jgi:hypothetical protein
MKTKQINNKVKLPGKAVNRCLAANLSPPKKLVVKELKRCYEVRNYSWQVAPLQSPFPLHSGKTNITRTISIKQK